MDFGDFDKLRKPTSYVSSDVLIYRRDLNGSLEVLTGRRQNDPWKNCLTVPFGGYVDPDDCSVVTASLREVEEETGLHLKITGFVGCYGPERFHYNFDGQRAIKTANSGHIRPVVALVFAGEAIGGELTDTAEQKGLCWVKPMNLGGMPMAFDHALALSDFLTTERRDGARKLSAAMLAFFK